MRREETSSPIASKAGQPPSFADVLQAQRTVDRFLPRTPLVPGRSLFPGHDGEVLLKLDALSALGSFKGRGVVFRLSRMSSSERRRGVITASTGNHGLAVAWAARRFRMAATIVLPETVPEFKADRIREHGGDVIRSGRNWNASLRHAKRIARQRGAVLVEDGEDPWLMAGAGTMVLETLRERPDVDCLVLPVGGGNLIAGGAIAAHGVRRGIRVVGVQSSRAQGVYRSWKRGHITSAPCHTFAGGIATTGPAELAFGVIRREVDDIKLVTEREMMLGIRAVFRHLSIVVEGAAAAPVAAVRRYRDEFLAQNVALMITGRTIDEVSLRKALALR